MVATERQVGDNAAGVMCRVPLSLRKDAGPWPPGETWYQYGRLRIFSTPELIHPDKSGKAAINLGQSAPGGHTVKQAVAFAWL